MSKHVNHSGEQNFLISLSKQTNGSNGFIPSGHHDHKKFWYVVIGIIMVIILFILGENIYSNHQSRTQPVHHSRATKVIKNKPKQKARKAHHKTNAQKIRERTRRRDKRLVQKRVTKARRIARGNQTRVTPRRQTTTQQGVRANTNSHATINNTRVR